MCLCVYDGREIQPTAPGETMYLVLIEPTVPHGPTTHTISARQVNYKQPCYLRYMVLMRDMVRWKIRRTHFDPRRLWCHEQCNDSKTKIHTKHHLVLVQVTLFWNERFTDLNKVMISSDGLLWFFFFFFSLPVVGVAGRVLLHTFRPVMRSPLLSFPNVFSGDEPHMRSRVPLRGELPFDLSVTFSPPCSSAFTSFSSASPSCDDLVRPRPLSHTPPSSSFQPASRSMSSKGLRLDGGRMSSPLPWLLCNVESLFSWLFLSITSPWLRLLLDLPGSFFRMGMLAPEGFNTGKQNGRGVVLSTNRAYGHPSTEFRDLALKSNATFVVFETHNVFDWKSWICALQMKNTNHFDIVYCTLLKPRQKCLQAPSIYRFPAFRLANNSDST